MGKRDDQRAVRVQVYIEDPKVELALRREARAAKLSLSRAAERAIERGLGKEDAADLARRHVLEGALRDHARRTARDMSILQELVVELARAFFLRLPDAPIDQDPLIQASAQRRLERLLDAAAGRITAGGSIPATASEAERAAAGSSASVSGGLWQAG